MKTLLFLCVANSARSQMAEGLARSMAGGRWRVFSAGSSPGRLNPLAVAAMAEIGIDIGGQRSKGLDSVPLADVDTIVTLCSDEVCPTVPEGTEHLHWPLPDPAVAEGSDRECLRAFRAVRDEIHKRLPALLEGVGD